MHLGLETTLVLLCVFLAYAKAISEAVSLDYTEGSERHDVCQSFVALLFYVHGKHLRSCRDGKLT